MNLRRLEFTLTTKCNSRCIHCQAYGTSNRNEVMEMRDACSYLTEAVAVSKLESFMIFGGEPMLYPERATATFQRASELGIPRIDMITNGAWGQDKKETEDLARNLKTAGLNNLDISVDAFHQQHIPIEYPRNAAMASKKACIEHVRWNVTVLDSIDSANEYDTKTRHILKTLQPIGIEAHIHKILPAGRAIENLRQYLKPSSLDGPCEGEPTLGDTLTDPRSICIEPSGKVNICWHLSIGNAKQKPLSRIISEYDWQKDPIIRILVNEGPKELQKRHEALDRSSSKKEYVNKCHLCIETRRICNLV